MHPSVHVPVMLEEVLENLEILPHHCVVDGTIGGGGHAQAILAKLDPDGLLIGMDRDADALNRTGARLQSQTGLQNKPFRLFQGSYALLPEVLRELSRELVDRIILDLGLSSDQLADANRGFSFRVDGPLDLRFATEDGPTAADLLAYQREEDLANLIYQYGEERFSRRIAKAIVESRRIAPITTTRQLCDIIHRSVPGKTHGRIDCATRTFQALRISVNQELQHLERALQELPHLLAPQGRIAVISFHSLEDRLVKNAFRDHPLLERLTKKPILPSPGEVQRNPRARSAKLRVARRTE